VEVAFGKVPDKVEMSGRDGEAIETVLKIIKGVSVDDL